MLFVLKKKYLAVAFCLLLVTQIILMFYLCARYFEGKSVSVMDFTVVIDAGHGGVDGGVVANGLKESDLNLEYSKALGELFSRGGFNVIYTRKTSDGLYGFATNGFKMRDMKKRKEIILNAKPNLVISVHMNKFSNAARSGPQVFFQSESDSGQLLASSVQNVFNNYTGNSHEAIGGDFYICRESPCVAIIVECGFLSNLSDAQKLQTESYQSEICECIFSGVMLYLYSS